MSSCDSHSFTSGSELSFFSKNDNVKKAENVRQKNEFGNFQETYNWVECESVHFPGKPYFFNLRTQDSTWIRPVSRHVQLQRFSRKSKIFDNNLTPEVEIPLILSSESEKDDYECTDNEDNEDKRQICNNSKILARMYYGAKLDEISTNNGTLDFNDYFNYFMENLYGKNGSDSHEVTDEETVCDKNAHENSSIIMSNFLEVELSVSEDVLDIKENIEPINENDTSFVGKPVIYSASDSDEEKKENNACQNYIVPRLKKLKPVYLLKKNLKEVKSKRLMKKRIPLQEKKLQESKIIREMYGTTTISYDPVEPELPPGVKRRNLSDSSSEEENIRSVLNNSSFFNIDSYVVNLSSNSSSSSSSSSSCSCSCSCSCSSLSSATNKTSSRKGKST